MLRILWGIVFLGGFLRFWGLGDQPLWVDEVYYGFLIRDGGSQEFLTVWLGQIFGLRTEFELRLSSAIAGTLTILAVYHCLDRWKIWGALTVAVMPLFVFWSRMARPYAVAGMFMVMGWRYWQAYPLALITTPISLVGVRLRRGFVVVGAIVIALLMYLIRPDAGRDWAVEQFFISSRWWYLPGLAVVLYVFDVVLPYLESRYKPRWLVEARGKI